ncbi:hypothetical protein [Sinomicrobium weinanense]|uniref:Uncharacterized protein n=1 Tax=Sinomicrobium weinanense TaxID=2842200 RepID=A0A926JUD3_9FLAO|nr:hypothetical protein [Sinomicrobium weinanense]MBC9797687.1 hypothetical protein [Sinomicrobium weinanense]MBU3125804.1 hypothetical protein [Sinomicrobium weinanense]
MKKILLLFGVFLLWNCSGDDDKNVEENEENQQEEYERMQNEQLKGTLRNARIVFEFGIQENELEEKLKSYKYKYEIDNFLWGEYYRFNDSPMYGMYHREVSITDYYEQWILIPNTLFYENNAEGTRVSPFVNYSYFYENNEKSYLGEKWGDREDMSRPYYQVQMHIEKVNEETYDIVKNWILEMDEVKGAFVPVNDLKYTNERIVQEGMIIEMGDSPEMYSTFPFVIVRFYSDKAPEYAQYME